ncbi:MAG: ATP-binding cassette domain-containing protein [Treponema sp.]|nr:ATP-binding cassette domain-containing protein [Treponema sp.]
MEEIRLEGASFRFPGRAKPLLRDINLVIHRGDRVLLHGPSGSGKSTLLAILAGLVPDHVGGELTGTIRLSYTRKALVLQNPEAQVITPTVEEELAFPLENRAMPAEEMGPRITAILERFGMAALRCRNPLELSGGECQRLSLAAALIQEPDILFLDEPTSYLDEARSQELFRDLESLPPQVTVVLVEHRLELVEHFCKRWICIDGGTISEQASWDEVLACTPSLELPETAPSADGGASDAATAEKGLDSSAGPSQPLLEIRSLSHRYGPPGAPPILHNLSLSIEPGTITAIMGASGSGKTTLLKKIIRLLPVEQNTVFLYGRDITSMASKEYYQHIAYIPQNPEHLFLEDTVKAELAHGAHNAEEALRLARLFSLEHRLKAHPFKLSEGEKRRLTLCIALSMGREFIIMDEPTYGLDREARHRLASYLSMPELSGTSILLVSHDSLFVNALAERANRNTKILWLSEGQFKEAD